MTKFRNRQFTLFSPIWPKQLTDRRINNGKARISEVGREVYCSKCDTYWPADTEFFSPTPGKVSGLDGWCKACHAEYKQLKKAA